MAKVFRGFSTVGGDHTTNYKLYDVLLVKQDLINHFHTRKGERVMRPDWGCEIWDYLMEPFTAYVKEEIIKEAIRICESDSRVSVVNVDAVQSDHALNLLITLNFHPYEIIDSFVVAFEQRQAT